MTPLWVSACIDSNATGYTIHVLLDIDHVQIACPRGAEGEAREFFGNLLGMAEIEKPEPLRSRGGCWFAVGTRQLHIGVEPDFRPAAKAHPAFAVANVAALFERLSLAGVHCAWDESLPDVRRFYAMDPWGNRLEFLQPASDCHGDLG